MKNFLSRLDARSAVAAHAPSFALILALGLGLWASSPAFGGQPPSSLKTREFQTLEDLRHGFSQGLLPDPNSPAQLKAFAVYLKIGFGDPKTDLGRDDLVQTIADELKQHPELIKVTPQFRNLTLTTQDRIYPVTPELKSFLDPQVRGAKTSLGKLFQVDANAGDWQKILGFAGEKDAWPAFFEKSVSAKLREKLIDESLTATERAVELYPVLKAARERLKSVGANTRPITQAMIDLLHSASFLDPSIAEGLKSQDGMMRLKAYAKARAARDSLTQDLEPGQHFDVVLDQWGRADGVTVPTGVTNPKGGISKKLSELEDQVVKGSTLSGTSTTRTIRQLSVFEAPFRSCLGGSDCSSRTYPKRALDPNYHYFTVTNDQGESTGHITVVLGEGKVAGRPVKVAFVDKVQNVDHLILPVLMEGVRQSIAEKGYRLVIPDDMGNHNGISNEKLTRLFIQDELWKGSNLSVSDFKPHTHDYRFKNAFSRADQALASKEVPALKNLPEGTVLEKGQVDQPWFAQAGVVDLDRIVRKTWKLKESPKFRDRLKYLQSQGVIRGLQLQVDPQLDETLKHWIQDEKQDIKVRKASLIFEWEENRKPLHELLADHPVELQLQLVDQIAQTPRLRKRLVLDLGKAPGPGEFQNWYLPEVVARLLSDSEPIMRQAAIAAMKNLSLADARPLIRKALRDSAREVRLVASGAMALLPPDEVLGLIQGAMQDLDLRYRSAVVSGVRFLPPIQALPLIKAAMKDPEAEVRLNAFAASLKVLPPDEARPLFRSALRDPASEVRLVAGAAMKILPTADQIELIQEAFADSDWKVRLAAVPAVNHLRPSDAATFIPRIRGWFSDGALDPDQKRVVARGLKDLGQLAQLTLSEAKDVLHLMAEDPVFFGGYLKPLLVNPDVAEHFLKDPKASLDWKKAAAKELKRLWTVERLNPEPSLAKEAFRLMAGEEDFYWYYAQPILEIRDDQLLLEVSSLFTDRTFTAAQKRALAKGMLAAARLPDLSDAAAKEVLRVMAGDQYFYRYADPILKGKGKALAQEVGDWLLGKDLNLAQKKNLVEGIRSAGHLGSLSAKAARAALDVTDGSLAERLLVTHPDAVEAYLKNPGLKSEVRIKVEAAVKSRKGSLKYDADKARQAGQPDLNREAALSLIDRLNDCGEQLSR